MVDMVLFCLKTKLIECMLSVENRQQDLKGFVPGDLGPFQNGQAIQRLSFVGIRDKCADVNVLRQ